eukprot:2132601-Pyramimonas_sp.AAC.1
MRSRTKTRRGTRKRRRVVAVQCPDSVVWCRGSVDYCQFSAVRCGLFCCPTRQPQRPPRQRQGGPRGPRGGLKCLQEGPPKRHKTILLQDGPTAPNTAPRRPRAAPKTAQDGRAGQERLTTASEAHRRPQEALMRTPRGSSA